MQVRAISIMKIRTMARQHFFMKRCFYLYCYPIGYVITKIGTEQNGRGKRSRAQNRHSLLLFCDPELCRNHLTLEGPEHLYYVCLSVTPAVSGPRSGRAKNEPMYSVLVRLQYSRSTQDTKS